MNHLMNIYVSRNFSDQVMIGNYIGNRVKPSQYLNYPQEILKGILLRHKIDEFIKNSSVFERSRKRLKPCFVKRSTLLVGIFYEHFLAANWNKYHSSSLNATVQEGYLKIIDNMPFISFRFRRFVLRLFVKGYINNLATLAGVHDFMLFINFPTNLYASIEDLIQNYQLFKCDFEEFLPELNKYILEIHPAEKVNSKIPVKYLYAHAG
jgi:acyl carrier protein phosphodiesterase